MQTESNWRATYVPGRWVVLAGPTSVVIMQPAPAHMSGLLNDLWLDVVEARDVSDLAQRFSAFRLDLMPHFAAFFWSADGMHSLLRGSLRAVDAETGEVVADGEGFHTWNEVGLSHVRQVHVQMDEVDEGEQLALPLAVGVVLASSITVDATQTVPLVLPTTPPVLEGADQPVAAAAPAEPEPAEAAVEPAAAAPAAPFLVPVPDLPGSPTEDDEGVDDEPEPAAVAEEPEPHRAYEPETEPEEQVESATGVLQDGAPEPDAAELEPAVEESEDAVEQPSPPPVAPAWPAEPSDAWGVRDAESAEAVGLVVDEDHDGVPDIPRSGVELAAASAAEPQPTLGLGPVPLDPGPSPLDLGPAPAEPAPPAQGFPGFPGADVAQNQGGFLAAPLPPSAPQPSQAPPPPWGQPQGGMPQQPGPFGQGPSQPFGGQNPFGVPEPVLPPAPYSGQPFSSQPPFGQPSPFGPPQPAYPQSPSYGGSPSGPMASPVPPPAAYAPAAPQPQGPSVPSEPSVPTSQVSADTGDSTIFSTGIAMTHKPAAPRQSGENLILAVVCAFGHPNPPGSHACRVCRQPVDNANPRLMHRPTLAQLVTAGGARVELTDAVLIGRAPQPQSGDGNPILLPVPSPHSDISRTHLKVAARDWEIVATDLHSTNGTMLVRPGQAPVRMVPGTPVTVEPGTILDLGDGGIITVALPA